ncbi:hypothetical protein [Roseiflexus sp.]|uniref:hypothetical protein n=1 Tax=Roseiflexus sp. TaxID=2562120 RepID=UPI0021DBF41F|nr:hypothetical protein [Roseiflexus sp.]GIV98601.1 MAG: hypothetical protein KatS3mg058_0005 [Roseiflexus sp.]
MKNKYTTPLLLIAAMVAVFIARAWMAAHFTAPRAFEMFDILTVIGALFVLLKDHRSLQQGDWLTALLLDAVVGVGMLFATLFSPYPYSHFDDLVLQSPLTALRMGAALALLWGCRCCSSPAAADSRQRLLFTGCKMQHGFGWVLKQHPESAP